MIVLCYITHMYYTITILYYTILYRSCCTHSETRLRGEEENNCKANPRTRNVIFSEQHLSSVINRAHVWSESHRADPNNSNLQHNYTASPLNVGKKKIPQCSEGAYRVVTHLKPSGERAASDTSQEQILWRLANIRELITFPQTFVCDVTTFVCDVTLILGENR